MLVICYFTGRVSTAACKPGKYQSDRLINPRNSTSSPVQRTFLLIGSFLIGVIDSLYKRASWVGQVLSRKLIVNVGGKDKRKYKECQNEF